MSGTRPDDITEECWTRRHDGCTGYTDDWSDPSLCECQCHDDLANHLYGDDDTA